MSSDPSWPVSPARAKNYSAVTQWSKSTKEIWRAWTWKSNSCTLNLRLSRTGCAEHRMRSRRWSSKHSSVSRPLRARFRPMANHWFKCAPSSLKRNSSWRRWPWLTDSFLKSASKWYLSWNRHSRSTKSRGMRRWHGRWHSSKHRKSRRRKISAKWSRGEKWKSI